MFGEGLNVRLAISEGVTATLSGQMSIILGKRFGRRLQVETLTPAGAENDHAIPVTVHTPSWPGLSRPSIRADRKISA
jgi:hypothetical protein